MKKCREMQRWSENVEMVRIGQRGKDRGEAG